MRRFSSCAMNWPSATDFPMNKTISYPKFLPPTYLLAAVLLMLGLHFLFPITQLFVGLWRLTGILPLILGIIASYMAEGQFRRAGTTVQPFETSSLLVTDGLYRFSRNPMYLGMALVLLGCACTVGATTALAVPPAFMAIIEWRFIRPEEAMLRALFPQEYPAYCSRVRRWL